MLSAFTIAKHMNAHGHKTVFAGAKGPMADEIQRCMPYEPLDIPVFHGSRQTYFTWGSFAAVADLQKIIRKHHIEVVHAFDARSYIHAYLACLRERIPVLCTLCGGIDPYYNLPISPSLIVFSEEQKKKMVKMFHWPDEKVQVLRTRLDLQQLLDDENRLTDEEAESFGLISGLPKLMMISSFDDTKIRSIHKLLDATAMLFEKGFDFQLVLVGGKGNLFLDAQSRGRAICNLYGEGKILFTGPVLHAFRLLQRADIVLGVGRSAFEGMAYGKPTMIVGEKGFAGTVSPEKVGNIAWFNFSGRNESQDIPAVVLVDEIERLLLDESERERVGFFGREFVFREIDVARGILRLDEIYQQILSLSQSLSLWQRWISFGKCLVPIFIDNELHTFKSFVKSSIPWIKK